MQMEQTEARPLNFAYTEYDIDIWRAVRPRIERERAEWLEHIAAGRVPVEKYSEAVGRLQALDWVLAVGRDAGRKE